MAPLNIVCDDEKAAAGTGRDSAAGAVARPRAASRSRSPAGQPPPIPAGAAALARWPGTGEAAGRRGLVGFDFDCTLTTRHFFKVFAHGYLQGDMAAHPHCADFATFCGARRLPTKIGAVPKGIWAGNAIGAALEAFCVKAGEAAFRELFRETFLGGESRIQLLATSLARLRALGAETAIVTAGSSGAVLRALGTVPELRPFFPPAMVWDVSQARHKAGSVMAMKALMLRDLRPDANPSLLVDDSLLHDPPPAWALETASVDAVAFPTGQLPYEGQGLGAEALELIAQRLQIGASSC